MGLSQQMKQFGVTRALCQTRRRFAIAVLRAYIRAVDKQQLDDINGIFGRRIMQRRIAGFGLRMHIRAIGQQQLGDINGIFRRRIMQRCLAGFGLRMHIRAIDNQ